LTDQSQIAYDLAMARPKEFEREAALKGAIGVFSDHGYDGVSTETLLQAMGISRQSMYDTFGDKWRLYLESLQRYTAESIGDQLRVLGAPSSAIKGLEAHLGHAVAQAIADPVPRCLGISSICEFGRSNPEVTMVNDTSARTIRELHQGHSDRDQGRRARRGVERPARDRAHGASKPAPQRAVSAKIFCDILDYSIHNRGQER
jgi:AcrR family transcriptional regulator